MRKTAWILAGALLLLACAPARGETGAAGGAGQQAGNAYGIALPVKSVFADGSTSFLIGADDTLYAFGNTRRLGIGKEASATPEKIMENVASVSAAGDHALIVKTDGSLWACGDNGFGQLGNGTTQSSDVFIRVMEDVQTAIADKTCSFAIKKDGSLFMWGEKEYFLDRKEWDRWPENGNMPEPVHVMDGVAELALGTGYALVLANDGTLYIQGNYHYTLVIDGRRDSWYYDLTPIMTGIRSVAAANVYWLALGQDAKLWHHGRYSSDISLNFGEPELLMENVQAIGVTDSYTYGSAFALSGDGTLWALGDNAGGQLGDGTGNDSDAPLVVLKDVARIAGGAYHAVAKARDGRIWTWGSNSSGQLGTGYMEYTLHPTRIMEDVAAFDEHDTRLVRKTDGGIWTWGYLKNDAPPRLAISGAREYYSVGYILGGEANGYTEENQYAIKEDGSLWAWGKNEHGQIGDGTFTDRPEPVLVLENVKAFYPADSISGMSYALAMDGTAYQWGSETYPNKDGSLGGNPDNIVQITSPTPLPIKNVKQMAAGLYNETMLAVTEDGTLFCWGDNENGLVGNGKKTHQRQAAKIMTGVESAFMDDGRGICAALKKDGSLYVWGGIKNANGEIKPQRKPKKILDGAAEYTSNGECILAVKSDGSLWAWGYFPTGVTLTKAQKVMDSGASLIPGVMSYVLLGDKSLWELNVDARKPYAAPEKMLDHVTAVSQGVSQYGKSTVLAITGDGGVWAWGANRMGSAGNGKVSGTQDTPLRILDNAKAVKTLYDLSLAITQDGGLWVWGNWSPDPNYMKGLPICILP